MIILELFWGWIPIIILFIYGLEKNNFLIEWGSSSKYFSYTTILISFILSITYLYKLIFSFKFSKKEGLYSFFLVISFVFLIGLLGPFFIPPADTIYHLNVLWDFLFFKTTKDYPNREFIGKIIFESISFFAQPVKWNERLNIVYAFHLIVFSNLVLSAYISSRLCFLNVKWSVVSAVLMILFFGTSQFSYISYYTLAPTSINISIYWLLCSMLISLIINKCEKDQIIQIGMYTLYGLLFTPILYFHHKQEIGFLFYLYLLVSIILSFKLITHFEWFFFRKYIYLPLIFVILFFPHLTPLKKIFSIFDLSLKEELFNHVMIIKNLFIIGKLNGPRIYDTLSFYGFIPLIVVSIYFLLPKQYKFNNKKKEETFFIAMLPGLMPFWILLVPFNVLIWAKSITAAEVFWRATYTTQFWISIAYLLQILEPKVTLFIQRRCKQLLIR
ncbi:MAG: hypothetical protein H7A25_25755 [Leptospiraceae bacterium]|nr:hypothetical protein [Leptospiraceae bacterium]